MSKNVYSNYTKILAFISGTIFVIIMTYLYHDVIHKFNILYDVGETL